LLECLLGGKVLSDDFIKRLKKHGIDVRRLQHCLKKYCRKGERNTSIPASKELVTILERPEILSALREFMNEIE